MTLGRVPDGPNCQITLGPQYFGRRKALAISLLATKMSNVAALGAFLTLQVVGAPAMPSTECATDIWVATWWFCTYSRSSFCVLRGGSGPAQKIAEIEQEMRITQKNKVWLEHLAGVSYCVLCVYALQACIGISQL